MSVRYEDVFFCVDIDAGGGCLYGSYCVYAEEGCHLFREMFLF